mmetsp:Transcript_14691/g.22145  ORF Transcript_14691/g.22145 Transcript_14691/m.22145 type:complete len:94 (+) Transcript_14691:220-501(+)
MSTLEDHIRTDACSEHHEVGGPCEHGEARAARSSELFRLRPSACLRASHRLAMIHRVGSFSEDHGTAAASSGRPTTFGLMAAAKREVAHGVEQ